MSVSISCLPVSQNLGEFYVASIGFRELLKIVKRDPRKWTEDSSDKLVGVQRGIKDSRVKKISKYVTYDFATFPTSVVISLDERFVTIEPTEKCDNLVRMIIEPDAESDDLRLQDLENAGYIIDGQHRLYGLLKASHEIEDFELNVSIFVGIDNADRAEIFSTVNLTQTKVNRSHVYDLYDFQLPPSPYRTAHDIVVALDRHKSSPFRHKIKRLGIATPGRKKKSERVSQATIVRGILSFLPPDPDFERQKGILGEQAKMEPRESAKSRFLSPFYRLDDTAGILRLYLNYFKVVEDRWPIAWEDSENEFMLFSTNGFYGLNRFLRTLYNHLNPEPQIPKVITEREFAEELSKIRIKDEYFTTENFPPGSSGASRLFHKLNDLWSEATP